jgi:hypothetical protein
MSRCTQSEQVELAERAAHLVEATLGEVLPGAVGELRAMPDDPAPPPVAAADRDAAHRAAVVAELPEHVKADLLGGGRIPSAAELRAAADRARQA